MPAASNAHGHPAVFSQSNRASMLADPNNLNPSTSTQASRPNRVSLFHNPHWPPAPDAADLPTPAGLRAARARALSASSKGPPKMARADQVQAHALAAQAAHQQRLAAAARDREDEHGAQFASRRPVSFMAGFQFGPSSLGAVSDAVGMDIDAHAAAAFEAAPAVSYPSLNADDSMDFLDELQVDLALPLARSPVEERVPFVSPTASVDITAFMPPPGPPVLVANDVTIAASAVPLADWACDIVCSLVDRTLVPHLTTSRAMANWCDQLVDPNRFVPGRVAHEGLRKFVNGLFASTLPSPPCLFLGLLYVAKLPIGNFRCLPSELDQPNTPAGVRALFEAFNPPRWNQQEIAFREKLYGRNHVHFRFDGDASSEPSLQVAQLVITLALMLGNKWLEDNTFTTRTWHDVSSLPQSVLRDLENEAIHLFGFSLVVGQQEMAAWFDILRAYTSRLVTREAIGVSGTANGLALARIDGTIRVVDSGTLAAGDTLPVGEVVFPQDDDDVVVFTPRSRARHMRSASEIVSGTTASDLFAQYVVDARSPDMFQFNAPHPAIIEARRRQAEVANSGYRWEQVQQEMLAREREQEIHVSAWPRPSRLEWNGSSGSGSNSNLWPKPLVGV